MDERCKSVHGTVIAIDGNGLLLQGKSGSGKSDLALRFLEVGARLVADDQAILRVANGQVFAEAPPQLFGRLEIRGIGIVDVPVIPKVCVSMVVLLRPKNEIERLPESDSMEILGVTVPVIFISAFEASAVAKIRFAINLRGLGGRG
ncbi:MAG: hypothetical protein CMM28_01595 [Rhodospirillaceae bacterium]|nr:hypothetical protein [Rhodospirillaceae bacterium]|tara:strand:+ start:800 stop:1240 length:441 start_codon:yes stop_codon:yes gene_type:complete